MDKNRKKQCVFTVLYNTDFYDFSRQTKVVDTETVNFLDFFNSVNFLGFCEF